MYNFISLDLEKCTGCRACELACSLNNEKQCNPEKARIRAIRTEDDGRIYTIPIICQQCEQAPCQRFCPSKALYRNPDTGAIVVDENTCIGCKRCVFVCPFGVPFIDESRCVSVNCNSCDGSPKFVEICPNDALRLTSYASLLLSKNGEKVD